MTNLPSWKTLLIAALDDLQKAQAAYDGNDLNGRSHYDYRAKLKTEIAKVIMEGHKS